MAGHFTIRNIPLIILPIKHLKNWGTYFSDLFDTTTKKHITYVTKNGLKFFARAKTTDRGIITTVALQDEYEIKKLKLKNATVLDIGGQNGYFSVFASQFAKKIYTYEPTPQNFAIIQKNIRLNKLENKVIPHNVAVAAKKSKLTLFLSGNTGGHSAYGEAGEEVTVDAISLKSIFDTHKIHHCDLLKMDIEGSEYDVFYALPVSYFKRIQNIRMEIHDVDTDKKNPKALASFLRQKGFEVYLNYPLLFARQKE